MRDRLQPSTAPADFRVANLQAVRGSNSKADSFRFTVVGCGVAVCLTNYSANAAHADNSSA